MFAYACSHTLFWHRQQKKLLLFTPHLRNWTQIEQVRYIERADGSFFKCIRIDEWENIKKKNIREFCYPPQTHASTHAFINIEWNWWLGQQIDSLLHKFAANSHTHTNERIQIRSMEKLFLSCGLPPYSFYLYSFLLPHSTIWMRVWVQNDTHTHTHLLIPSAVEIV